METRTELTWESLILGGDTKTYGGAVIKQDAGRTTVLKANTIMGKDVATGKFVPAVGATVATTTNIAVYIGGEIASADLVAGDIEDCDLIVGGDCKLREDMLVVDGDASTLDTVVGTGDTATTLRDILHRAGIYPQLTETSKTFN